MGIAQTAVPGCACALRLEDEGALEGPVGSQRRRGVDASSWWTRTAPEDHRLIRPSRLRFPSA